MMKALSDEDLKNSPRGEAVYARLRAAIQRGELAPGERLREASIAEQLGVSRTPVREALHRLISEGLLSVGAARGVMVTALDRQQVLQLYALREVLEGAAAGFAARHASEAEIAGIRGLLEAMGGALDAPERLAEINRDFHREIYAAAHNRYLVQAASGLADSLNLLSGTTFSAPNRPQTAHVEHRAIVEAIERRDAETAEAVARQHIREAGLVRMRMLFGAR